MRSWDSVSGVWVEGASLGPEDFRKMSSAELHGIVAAAEAREIVSMVEYGGRLFVATRDGVYERRDDGRLHRVEFAPAALPR